MLLKHIGCYVFNLWHDHQFVIIYLTMHLSLKSNSFLFYRQLSISFNKTNHINEMHIHEEIKYSSSRDLRAQLRDIAPMNSEGSKIFCPNGPSANVSPLMENKCGGTLVWCILLHWQHITCRNLSHNTLFGWSSIDRQALPSVYGRNNDIMGNSIPGFGSVGAANAATVSQLRNELNAQAYFREWFVLCRERYFVVLGTILCVRSFNIHRKNTQHSIILIYV